MQVDLESYVILLKAATPSVIFQSNIRHLEEIYFLLLLPSAVFSQATVARKSLLMSEAKRTQSENHILAALPEEDYQRLSSHLEQVELHHGRILYEAGDTIDYVYFPSNSVISLVSQMSDGSNIEIGIAGYEGMIGISSVLGVDKSPHEMMVQIPDGGVRMKMSVLREEFKRGGALQDSLLRYVQLLLLQTSQLAACNRLHSIGERLARWLLMSHDRCRCDELPLTQELP